MYKVIVMTNEGMASFFTEKAPLLCNSKCENRQNQKVMYIHQPQGL